MESFAIVNYKGGVCKTTSAAGLGGALAKMGQRTLLIDMDPQGNLTKHVGVNKAEIKASMDDVLLDKAGKVLDIVVETCQEGLFLAPTRRALLNARTDLANRNNRDALLSRSCKGLEEYFDFVIIDTPPDEGILSVNAMYAAKHIIIPTILDDFALDGIGMLIDSILDLKASYEERNWDIFGVLVAKYDKRFLAENRLNQAILEEHFEEEGQIFKTMIRQDLEVSRAHRRGLTIHAHNPHSKAAQDYSDLAKEITSKLAPKKSKKAEAAKAKPAGRSRRS